MHEFELNKVLGLTKTLLNEDDYRAVHDLLDLEVFEMDDMDRAINRRGVANFWSFIKEEFDEVDEDDKVRISNFFTYNLFEEIGYSNLSTLVKSISGLDEKEFDVFKGYGISSAREILDDIDNDARIRSFLHAFLRGKGLSSGVVDLIPFEYHFAINPNLFLNQVCPDPLAQPKFVLHLLCSLGFEQVGEIFKQGQDVSLFKGDLDLQPKFQISTFLLKKTRIISSPIRKTDIPRSGLYMPVHLSSVCRGIYTYQVTFHKDGKEFTKNFFKGFDMIGRSHVVELFARHRKDRLEPDYYLQGPFFTTFIHTNSATVGDIFHLDIQGDGRYHISLTKVQD